MNQVNCPVCGNKCIKAGKTKVWSQRWLCRKCNSSVTHKIDKNRIFIKNEMPYLALIISRSKVYLYIAVARMLNITAIMAIPYLEALQIEIDVHWNGGKA